MTYDLDAELRAVLAAAEPAMKILFNTAEYDDAQAVKAAVQDAVLASWEGLLAPCEHAATESICGLCERERRTAVRVRMGRERVRPPDPNIQLRKG